MRRLLILSITFFSSLCFGQKLLDLQVDNDLFFGTDYYYSSGIFINYNIIKSPKDSIAGTGVSTWELGQEIYTPKQRYVTEIERYDHPYCGWLYVGYAHQRHWTDRASWRWNVRLGLTGEASLAQAFQNIYHRTILQLPELAWSAQQPQQVHVSSRADLFYRQPLIPSHALGLNLYGQTGTYQSFVGGRLGWMLGESSQALYLQRGHALAQDSWGLYAGINASYWFHDFVWQGDRFFNNSVWDFPMHTLRLCYEGGVAFQGKKWKFLWLIQSHTQSSSRQIKKHHRLIKIGISRYF